MDNLSLSLPPLTVSYVSPATCHAGNLGKCCPMERGGGELNGNARRLLYWPFSCLQLRACVRQWDSRDWMLMLTTKKKMMME